MKILFIALLFIGCKLDMSNFPQFEEEIEKSIEPEELAPPEELKPIPPKPEEYVYDDPHLTGDETYYYDENGNQILTKEEKEAQEEALIDEVPEVEETEEWIDYPSAH